MPELDIKDVDIKPTDFDPALALIAETTVNVRDADYSPPLSGHKDRKRGRHGSKEDDRTIEGIKRKSSLSPDPEKERPKGGKRRRRNSDDDDGK
jgi:hypothetical protein